MIIFVSNGDYKVQNLITFVLVRVGIRECMKADIL